MRSRIIRAIIPVIWVILSLPALAFAGSGDIDPGIPALCSFRRPW